MRKSFYAIVLAASALGAMQGQISNTALSMNGVVNAASFPGPDIGAQINAAISSFPDGCGEVMVPSGRFTQTTTIIKPRCTRIRGAASFGTTLTWSPKSGTAMLSEDSGGVNDYPEGDITDITLNGPGGSTSTVGAYLGGDPTGSTVSVYFNGLLCAATNTAAGCPTLPIPSTAYDDHQNFNRVRILNFGTAVQWGNHAWSTTISQTLISGNRQGLYFPSGLTDSGESITVINTRTQNNTTGLNLVGFSDFYFYGSSCDYNSTCGNVNAAHFYGEHFEQSSGTILTIAGVSQPNVEIFGGAADLTAATGTDAEMFYVTSTLNPTFKMEGTAIIAAHPVKNIVNWNGSGGSASLILEDLPAYFNIAAPTNAACDFWGCRIQDGQGNLAFSGKHAQLLLSGAASFLTVRTGTNSQPGASLGNMSGFAEIQGNGKGLRLDSTNDRGTTPIYFTNGFVNATGVSLTATSYIPTSSTKAPTGRCSVAGTLEITGDGHATYCKAGTLVWTTLY